MGLQVSAVVVELTEALATLSAAVGPLAGVQVHVVLELQLGRQLKITHTAAVITIGLWGKEGSPILQ